MSFFSDMSRLLLAFLMMAAAGGGQVFLMFGKLVVRVGVMPESIEISWDPTIE